MSYQKWIKWESERAIINALHDGDKSFTELVGLTDLSKPVLSLRLKELEKRGKIKTVPDLKTKRFLYHLNLKSLDDHDKRYIEHHMFSKLIVLYLKERAKDSSISDEEYATRLMDFVFRLFSLKMRAYRAAPLEIQREWLKTTLGLEFVESIPELFPEKRELLKYLTKGLSREGLSALWTGNLEEAEKKIVEMFEKTNENPTRG